MIIHKVIINYNNLLLHCIFKYIIMCITKKLREIAIVNYVNI